MSKQKISKEVTISETSTGYEAILSNYNGNSVICAALYDKTTHALKKAFIGNNDKIVDKGKISVDIPKDLETQNTYCKIFVLNSIDTMLPICKAFIVKK